MEFQEHVTVVPAVTAAVLVIISCTNPVTVVVGAVAGALTATPACCKEENFVLRFYFLNKALC